MSKYRATDEDYRLPLRIWIQNQINAGRFKGLEWLSGQSKIFRLPWVDKNKPNWKEHFEIFREWSIHRGRTDLKDLSRLKTNFRTALNNSIYFQEMKNASQLHKQTDNFKVYRILSISEIKSKSVTQEESLANVDDPHELKKLDKKGLDVLDNITIANLKTIQSENDQRRKVSASRGVHSSIYTEPTEDFAAEKLPIFSSRTYCKSRSGRLTSEDLAKAEEMETEVELGTHKFTSFQSIILQQLGNAGFVMSEICHCQLKVSYGGETVLDEHLLRMDQGYRLFYGNQEKLLKVLRQHDAEDEHLAVCQYRGIVLPQPEKSSQGIFDILTATALGIVVWFDLNTLEVCVNRLCQSRVYSFDSHHTESPFKLERNQPLRIFSIQKYFMDYFQQVVDTPENVTPPDVDIILTVGIKPKYSGHRGLKIELIPQAVRFLRQCTKDSDSFASLCISNPLPIECLLRQIQMSL